MTLNRIFPRSSWTVSKTPRPRVSEPMEVLYIHHTVMVLRDGDRATRAQEEAYWRAVRAVHLARGYPDIAYCLAPETPVLTADLRWKPLGDIEVGDRLHAFSDPDSPTHGRWAFADVESVGRIRQPCYRVILEDGTEFVASVGHRWLVDRPGHGYAWRTTEELVHPVRGSGRPHAAVKLLEPWREEQSRDAGYLAGLWDADGWLMVRKQTREWVTMAGFAQLEGRVLDLAQKLLSERGIPYTVNLTDKETLRHIRIGGPATVLPFLGQLRPPRLLERWEQQASAGPMGMLRKLAAVPVAHAEFIGPQEVVTIATSTGTLIADGYAHHNCFGVTPAGRLYELIGFGREGIHTCRHNDQLAIVGAGNFEETRPSIAMRHAIVDFAVIAVRKAHLKRDFLLRGHRDVGACSGATACPGLKLYEFIGWIREQVRDRLHPNHHHQHKDPPHDEADDGHHHRHDHPHRRGDHRHHHPHVHG